MIAYNKLLTDIVDTKQSTRFRLLYSDILIAATAVRNIEASVRMAAKVKLNVHSFPRPPLLERTSRHLVIRWKYVTSSIFDPEKFLRSQTTVS